MLGTLLTIDKSSYSNTPGKGCVVYIKLENNFLLP
jgi:hypothetical protein